MSVAVSVCDCGLWLGANYFYFKNKKLNQVQVHLLCFRTWDLFVIKMGYLGYFVGSQIFLNKLLVKYKYMRFQLSYIF